MRVELNFKFSIDGHSAFRDTVPVFSPCGFRSAEGRFEEGLVRAWLVDLRTGKRIQQLKLIERSKEVTGQGK